MIRLRKLWSTPTLSLALLLVAMAQSACATPLAEPARSGTLAKAATPSDSAVPAPLPAGIRILRDVAYGTDERQRFDVYSPEHAHDAPVIFLVHGGGWRRGTKAHRGTYENKVTRWVPMGFIVISADYRVLPEADPLEQAKDVARALAAAQEQAESWGGDRRKFILMGHSAGGHLVSLLATAQGIAADLGVTPWLGTVALDSAAFDVVGTMENRHPQLFDEAFGSDPDYWKSTSPYHALTEAARPILAVCSGQIGYFCKQARQFSGKGDDLGVRSAVLKKKDYSHLEVNERLGADRRYTRQVESFLASLDEEVAERLHRRPIP